MWIWMCHLNENLNLASENVICHLMMQNEYEHAIWMQCEHASESAICKCHVNMKAHLKMLSSYACECDNALWYEFESVIWICQLSSEYAKTIRICQLNAIWIMNAHVNIPYEYECKSEYDMCNMPFECAKLIWVCHLNAVRVCIWICHLNMLV